MSRNQEQFVQLLKAASKIVATWPDWKRNVLGVLDRDYSHEETVREEMERVITPLILRH